MTLVEELSLRTRRVQPLVNSWRRCPPHGPSCRPASSGWTHGRSAKDERANLRKELRDLMLITLESPRRCAAAAS